MPRKRSPAGEVMRRTKLYAARIRNGRIAPSHLAPSSACTTGAAAIPSPTVTGNASRIVLWTLPTYSRRTATMSCCSFEYTENMTLPTMEPITTVGISASRHAAA